MGTSEASQCPQLIQCLEGPGAQCHVWTLVLCQMLTGEPSGSRVHDTWLGITNLPLTSQRTQDSWVQPVDLRSSQPHPPQLPCYPTAPSLQPLPLQCTCTLSLDNTSLGLVQQYFCAFCFKDPVPLLSRSAAESHPEECACSSRCWPPCS